MTRKGLFLLLGAAFVALAGTSWGQKASNWRVYKVADGLPESACSSVTISPQGKVLTRHLSQPAISQLDGYTINVLPAPSGGNSRVYESPAGQLWTVVREGLQEFKDGTWVLHRVPEVATETRSGRPWSVSAVPLCPAKQGLVIFLLPDRLLEFNSEASGQARIEVLRLADQTQLKAFSGMTPARDGGLWVAGARGFAKAPGPVRNLKPESEWQEFVVPESLQIENLEEPHEAEDGSLTTVAESTRTGQKVVVHFDGQHWTVESTGTERVRQAWCEAGQTCWATTSDSLLEWPEGRGEMVENEEISARQYLDLALEPSGVFWLATSEGLFRYAPRTWRSAVPTEKFNALIHCLTGDQEGRVWFVAANRLHLLQGERHQEYPFPAPMLRSLQNARALFALRDGTLVVEAGQQLFRFQPGDGAFSPAGGPDSARRIRCLGLLKDGTLCVQRSKAGASEQESPARLEAYDGNRFEPLDDQPPEPSVGSNFSALLTTQNGDLWLSGDRGTAWYHEKKWRTFPAGNKMAPEAAVCFAELADGRIWCAAQDQIWQFDGRNWSALRGGFDRINAVVRARRDGSLWVASNSGLYRFFQGAWVENGIEEGLPSAAVRELYEDARGRLWAGTTRGLSIYYPEADPDPPRAYIQNLTESQGDIPEGVPLTLSFSGQDKWKYTARERLLFSYRLDEGDWSLFNEANAFSNTVSLTDLPPGKHAFQVRAMDRNGNVSPNARLEFAVVMPWYRESRLVAILLVGLATALFFAGLAFNRHRRLLHSYAEVEKKVAERTRALEVASQQLVQSQKMTALGTLAAGIAHDFNNILSIIKGSAQIIEDNLDDPPKVRTRLDRIKIVVEQGAGIVKAMLGFSRESGQQPGVCEVNAVVEDTIKLLGDRFLREVQVRFEPAPDLPAIPASRDFIQQILLNFLFNAEEAMPKRKQVVLATRRLEKLPASLVLRPADAAAYLAISVQDTGCGISPENLPRIFEPFFTTKALSARRGTGLGLSMVYELAKKMGAGLAVDSVVDQGSTFTLILPVREVPAEATPESYEPSHHIDH